MSESRRFALVVANSTYDDPGLHALRAPCKDAEALRDVLGDAEIGGFQVEVLTDPTCHELRVKVDNFFAERTAQETLLLHFSGHGVKNAAGKLFLAAKDTRRHRLPSTAVSAGYVSDLMLETRAGWVVVFLDCCYAGAFERGLFTRADADAHVRESFRELDGHRGRGVFTASTAVEYVYDGDRPVPGVPGEASEVEEPASGPSPFTRAVVQGMLTGEADQDGDGEIGLSELSDYVRTRVRESTKYQTPQLWLFGTDGRDFPIARAGQRIPRPKPLPDDVYDAVRSSMRADRLWAVGKLESMLCGNDVGLALTATTTLRQLREDDSRRVVEEADRVLLTALPRTAESVCHLGQAVVGVPCAPQVVHVDGPPVVRRTMRALSSDSWLKTRCLPSRVEVSAEVSEPGHYEGKVLVATETGDVPVKVDVDGVPAEKRKPMRKPKRNPRTGEGSVPWAPSAARRVGPFLLAVALMVVAGLTPLMKSPKNAKPYEISETWTWSGHYEEVWWMLLIGLVVNGTLVVLALRRSPHLRSSSVFWFYLLVTLLTTLSLFLVFFLNSFQPPDDSKPSYEYAPFVGGWALFTACVIEVWGCVLLWRHRAGGSP
ncbi:caspase family protein [Streptomyces sp. NPDC054945]